MFLIDDVFFSTSGIKAMVR